MTPDGSDDGQRWYLNPDLEVVAGNKARWNTSEHRRRAFHGLGEVARYSMSFRAARIAELEKDIDFSIVTRDDVQRLTAVPGFSAMVVAKPGRIVFERFAPDFSATQEHSIQSITKTMTHLIIGRLVATGDIDLATPVGHYLPELGSGYQDASVQDVLDMNVVNEYSEDFTDPAAMYYVHEEAMGWRLPLPGSAELRMRPFLCSIRSDDTRNPTGIANYKDANTDVLAWLAEVVSGRSLRDYLAEIVDAAGLAGKLTITTDRDGVPVMDGGGCLTARDLARYGLLLLRRGQGVDGTNVSSAQFLEASRHGGVRFQSRAFPSGLRYHNHLMTDGRFVGHGGYAGQFLLVDLVSEVVCVFLSVSEEKDGLAGGYTNHVVAMLREIAQDS
jgi:CubicO group peptidase (beta-lactamase class C family)